MRLNRTEFRGSERYELTSVLGAGGMGVVYEAFDRELKSPIALKYLASTSPRAYFRFKREFRSLQDIEHENLVRLGELVSEDSHLFFTMELVDGVDIVSYCHHRESPSRAGAADGFHAIGADERTLSDEPEEGLVERRAEAPQALDEARVRRVFAQLVRGLQALHATAQVHRDIKPANVLVTAEERVVILDFGVVADIMDATEEHEPRLIGSVPYMAPEQAARASVTPASDFYAVGTMLFEALTGRLPFEGRAVDVLARKRNGSAPATALLANAPRELCELCSRLLDSAPERRPSGQEILVALEGVQTSSAASRAPAPPFIGRHAELAALERAYERARLGQVSLLHIEGVSGAGKSTLLRRFLASIRERPLTLVLNGRCSVRESVPYKTIDGVVDELVNSLAAGAAEPVAGHVSPALLRAFPTLSKVARTESLSIDSEPPSDPYAQRRALFESFRKFFERACAARTVVVAIDDVQWADADSLALLTALLNPAPRFALLLLTAGQKSSERSVRRALGGELLQLGSLPLEDSVALAASLLSKGRARAEVGALARRIAAESEGHPFLIDALAREALRDDAGQGGAAGLDAALASRVARLPERSRLMVQIAAIARGPLALRVLVGAAESSCPGRTATFLDVQALQNEHLLRLDELGRSRRVELYHDRIGVAVRATLPPDEQRRLHAVLVRALEREPVIDAGELAVHWYGAGDSERAAHHALAAAELADESLAFERAARLYAMALEYWPTMPGADRVREKLGDALTNAGLGAKAAHAYIAASLDALGERRLDLERRAADQLFRSGHVDAAAPLIQRVLRPLGLRIPRSRFWSLATLLWSRFRLSFVNLHAQLQSTTQVDSRRLRMLDACWSVAVGLAMVDNVRGASLQTQHLLLALDLGQPVPLLRALAAEAGYVAVTGHQAKKRVARLLARADEVARDVSDTGALAFNTLLKAMCAFLMGEWSAARVSASSAERVFAVRPQGATWELTNARTFHLWSSFYLGDFESMRQRAEEFTNEAEARGDRYAATLYRTGLLVTPWLADDEPERARERVAAAELGWARPSFDFQRYLSLLGHCLIDLYEGAPELAYRRMSEQWKGLSRSLYLRIQSLRIEAQYVRAVAAIGAAARSSTPAPLLREARKIAAKLQRERTSASLTLASLLRAGIAEVEGATTAREYWAEAEATARQHGMRLYADAAALRAAASASDSAAEASGRGARSRLGRIPIRDPDRFCRILVAGAEPRS